ncbi:MAG: hypothetical protein ACKOXR_05755 [Bacteroidota bacterium]
MKHLLIIIAAFVLIQCGRHAPVKKSEKFLLSKTFLFTEPQYFASNEGDTIKLVHDSAICTQDYKGYFGGKGCYLEGADYHYSLFRGNQKIDQLRINFFSQYSESIEQGGNLRFDFANYSFEIPEFNGFSDTSWNIYHRNDTTWLKGFEYTTKDHVNRIIKSDSSECPFVIKLKSGIIKFKINDVLYSRISPLT